MEENRRQTINNHEQPQGVHLSTLPRQGSLTGGRIQSITLQGIIPPANSISIGVPAISTGVAPGRRTSTSANAPATSSSVPIHMGHPAGNQTNYGMSQSRVSTHVGVTHTVGVPIPTLGSYGCPLSSPTSVLGSRDISTYAPTRSTPLSRPPSLDGGTSGPSTSTSGGGLAQNFQFFRRSSLNYEPGTLSHQLELNYVRAAQQELYHTSGSLPTTPLYAPPPHSHYQTHSSYIIDEGRELSVHELTQHQEQHQEPQQKELPQQHQQQQQPQEVARSLPSSSPSTVGGGKQKQAIPTPVHGHGSPARLDGIDGQYINNVQSQQFNMNMLECDPVEESTGQDDGSEPSKPIIMELAPQQASSVQNAHRAPVSAGARDGFENVTNLGNNGCIHHGGTSIQNDLGNLGHNLGNLGNPPPLTSIQNDIPYYSTNGIQPGTAIIQTHIGNGNEHHGSCGTQGTAAVTAAPRMPSFGSFGSIGGNNGAPGSQPQLFQPSMPSRALSNSLIRRPVGFSSTLTTNSIPGSHGPFRFGADFPFQAIGCKEEEEHEESKDDLTRLVEGNDEHGQKKEEDKVSGNDENSICSPLGNGEIHDKKRNSLLSDDENGIYPLGNGNIHEEKEIDPTRAQSRFAREPENEDDFVIVPRRRTGEGVARFDSDMTPPCSSPHLDTEHGFNDGISSFASSPHFTSASQAADFPLTEDGYILNGVNQNAGLDNLTVDNSRVVEIETPFNGVNPWVKEPINNDNDNVDEYDRDRDRDLGISPRGEEALPGSYQSSFPTPSVPSDTAIAAIVPSIEPVHASENGTHLSRSSGVGSLKSFMRNETNPDREGGPPGGRGSFESTFEPEMVAGARMDEADRDRPRPSEYEDVDEENENEKLQQVENEGLMYAEEVSIEEVSIEQRQEKREEKQRNEDPSPPTSSVSSPAMSMGSDRKVLSSPRTYSSEREVDMGRDNRGGERRERGEGGKNGERERGGENKSRSGRSFLDSPGRQQAVFRSASDDDSRPPSVLADILKSTSFVSDGNEENDRDGISSGAGVSGRTKTEKDECEPRQGEGREEKKNEREKRSSKPLSAIEGEDEKDNKGERKISFRSGAEVQLGDEQQQKQQQQQQSDGSSVHTYATPQVIIQPPNTYPHHGYPVDFPSRQNSVGSSQYSGRDAASSSQYRQWPPSFHQPNPAWHHFTPQQQAAYYAQYAAYYAHASSQISGIPSSVQTQGSMFLPMFEQAAHSTSSYSGPRRPPLPTYPEVGGDAFSSELTGSGKSSSAPTSPPGPSPSSTKGGGGHVRSAWNDVAPTSPSPATAEEDSGGLGDKNNPQNYYLMTASQFPVSPAGRGGSMGAGAAPPPGYPSGLYPAGAYPVPGSGCMGYEVMPPLGSTPAQYHHIPGYPFPAGYHAASSSRAQPQSLGNSPAHGQEGKRYTHFRNGSTSSCPPVVDMPPSEVRRSLPSAQSEPAWLQETCERVYRWVSGDLDNIITSAQNKTALTCVFNLLGKDAVKMPAYDKWFDQVFQNFDEENSGYIDFDAFSEMVRQYYEHHETYRKRQRLQGSNRNDTKSGATGSQSRGGRSSAAPSMESISDNDDAKSENSEPPARESASLDVENESANTGETTNSSKRNSADLREGDSSGPVVGRLPTFPESKCTIPEYSHSISSRREAVVPLGDHPYGAYNLAGAAAAVGAGGGAASSSSHRIRPMMGNYDDGCASGSIASSRSGYRSVADSHKRMKLPAHLEYPAYEGRLKIFDDYEFHDQAGKGAFGRVMVVKHKKSKAIRACKAIHVQNDLHRSLIDNEIECLQRLNHPNILKLYETYVEESTSSIENEGRLARNIYLVMEMCNGGDLFHRILNYYDRRKMKLTERVICQMLQQMLSGINYCHAQDIIHRDIKPDNILFVSKSDDSDLKIIDFGLASFKTKILQNTKEVKIKRKGALGKIARLLPSFGTGKHFISYHVRKQVMQRAGTAHYMAPEMIEGSYDEKCDLFSIGIIGYQLLTGVHPFYEHRDDEEKVRGRIMNEKPVEFPKDIWKPISHEAKFFCMKLLEKNALKRISAEEAMKCKWIQDHSKSMHFGKNEDISTSVFEGLRRYQGHNKLKKAVLQLLARELSEFQMLELRKRFLALDSTGTGLITREELKKGMKEVGYKIDDEGVLDIIKSLGDETNGAVIGYNEFVGALIERVSFTRTQLQQVFQKLDTDKSGTITPNKLQAALTSQNITLPEVQEIWREVDPFKNPSAGISFSEFCALFNFSNESEADEDDMTNFRI